MFTRFSKSIIILILLVTGLIVLCYKATQDAAPGVIRIRGISDDSDLLPNSATVSQSSSAWAYSSSLPQVSLIYLSPDTFESFAMAGNSYHNMSSLPLELEWASVCNGPPLEFLRKQIRGKKKIFITIEPLEEIKTFASQIIEVSPQEFITGFKKIVSIPRSEEPLHLGIFFCSDANGSGNCKSKVPYSGASVENRRLSEPLSEDGLFYFSYLLVSGNTLFSSTKTLEVQQLKDLFLSMSIGKDRADNLVSVVRSYSNKLQNLPAALAKRSILIKLPINQSSCR